MANTNIDGQKCYFCNTIIRNGIWYWSKTTEKGRLTFVPTCQSCKDKETNEIEELFYANDQE